MKTKNLIVLFLVVCLLFTGCIHAKATPISGDTTMTASEDTVTTEPAETAKTILPLSDTTMENLTDAILSVSLEEGDAYVDDSGIMQMDLKIYGYDRYDMLDIANLNVGDILIRHSGDVKVTSKEQNGAGTFPENMEPGDRFSLSPGFYVTPL